MVVDVEELVEVEGVVGLLEVVVFEQKCFAAWCGLTGS